MRRLACLIALTLATPAGAQSPRDRMFPGDAACYLRHYTAEHLTKHPAQQVVEIGLAPLPGDSDARFLVLALSVRLRGNSETYAGFAECENESGHLYCQMEGDAGAFALRPRKNAVHLKVNRVGIGFEGAGGFVELSGTAGDDREFLLPAVPAGSCP